MESTYKPERGMAERLFPIAVRAWFGEDLTAAVESWNNGAREFAEVRQQQATAEGILRAPAAVALCDITAARDTAHAAKLKADAIEVTLREQLDGLLGEIKLALRRHAGVSTRAASAIAEEIAKSMVSLGFKERDALRAIDNDCHHPELVAARHEIYACNPDLWNEEEDSNRKALARLTAVVTA